MKSAQGHKSPETEGRLADVGKFLRSVVAKQLIKPAIRKAYQLIRSRGEPLIPGSLNRLELWFQRMAMGNKVDDRTPFYHSTSWFQILKDLKRVYSSRSGLMQLPDYGVKAYLEVEADQLDSVGPKSMFLDWFHDGPDKLEAVMKDKPKKACFDDAAWTAALKDVSSAAPTGKGRIKSIPLEEALKGMGGNAKFALDDSTNGAFPAWCGSWANTNKMSSTGTQNERARLEQFKLIESKCKAIVAAASRPPYDELIPLSFVGTTSQRTVSKGLTPLKRVPGKPLKGKRIVIAMPKEEVWSGKTLMAPLQPALLRSFINADGTAVIAGWLPQPQLDKTMQQMLSSAESQGLIVLSGDISAFDATLPPFAMWDVAKAISRWFDPQDAKLFLSILRADIYDTTVLSPSGAVGPGPSSVKSGSIFTSLMGCMCNYAIQRYGHHKGLYKLQHCHVMGDDFVAFGESVTPEQYEKAFADFGMECNASKQFYQRGMCHFLQRLHILGFPGGQGSVARIGGGALVVEDDTQLKYDERTPFAFIFQALARLENAAFNPNFEGLVEWLAQGDKRYHLGSRMSVESIVRRAGSYAERKMKEATNRPWTSTGSGVPFSNWSVNRVLRGVKMPPIGKDRYEFVYGVKYDDVEVDMRKLPKS